jgi:hypothetical protein
MSEPARTPKVSLYEQDFYAWSEDQSRKLKSRSAAGLDWKNLAEEIGSLGGSERSEIRSRLVIVLLHLLKWQYQPSKRKAGWTASILEARDQLNERLKESPSLRPYPATVLKKQYTIARLRAADEIGVPLESVPTDCPYAVVEILDEEFFPDDKQ